MTATEIAKAKSSARQMMAAALADKAFDWVEAERLAALPDFKVAKQMTALKEEVSHG